MTATIYELDGMTYLAIAQPTGYPQLTINLSKDGPPNWDMTLDPTRPGEPSEMLIDWAIGQLHEAQGYHPVP